MAFAEGMVLMVMTLKSYADRHGYFLVAAFGKSPHDTYYYYVRRDFADSGAIITGIRGLESVWRDEGRAMVNYAALTALHAP